MKKLIIILMIIGTGRSGYGQTWGEWFNQANTQKKYLLENIAANEVYLDVLKKGYGIYKDGTDTWGSIKSGDLSMDQTYFTSLKNVNPVIAKNPKVQAIANYQNIILQLYQKGKKEFAADQYLHNDEKTYITSVYQNLLTECSKSMDELKMVITNGSAQMTDDERMKRLDKLYDDMKDKKSFIAAFNNDTRILNLQRQKESVQNGIVKSYYNN